MDVDQRYDEIRVQITRAALCFDGLKNGDEPLPWWEARHDKMHDLLCQIYLLIQEEKKEEIWMESPDPPPAISHQEIRNEVARIFGAPPPTDYEMEEFQREMGLTTEDLLDKVIKTLEECKQHMTFEKGWQIKFDYAVTRLHYIKADLSE